jgi:DNA-binding NtrC family response regulator
MPINVYYIDDEIDLCEIFSDTFADDNIQIKTFTDPKAGIEAIKNAPPDFLFLDYRLPGTNGDLIAQSVDPKIPKILVTGEMEVKTQYKFQKIISKPYKTEEVMSIFNSK